MNSIETKSFFSFLILIRAAALTVLAAFCFVYFQIKADLSFREAGRLEKNFDWDEAVAAYGRAVWYAPWYAEYDEAAARLAEKRAALSLNPKARKDWLMKSLQSYQAAVHKHPYWPASFYKIGRLLEELKQNDRAGVFFSKARVLEPTRDVYLAADAYWHLRQGKVAEAIALFEKLQKMPFKEVAGLTTQKILEDVYPFEKRTVVLERLLNVGWVDHYTLAQFLSSFGRWDDADSYYQDALKGARQELGLRAYMDTFAGAVAEKFIQNGRYEEAMLIYQDAVRDNPNEESYALKRREIEKLKALDV